MAKRKAPEHPVISNRQTTFARLGLLLKTSPSNAASKYYRVKQAYGKVTMAQMQHPFRDPQVADRIAINTVNREVDDLVRHARLHGAMHTGITYNVDPKYVKQLVAAADRKIADALQPKPVRRSYAEAE